VRRVLGNAFLRGRLVRRDSARWLPIDVEGALDDWVIHFYCLMFRVDGRTAENRSEGLGHGAYRVSVAADAGGRSHRSRTYRPDFEGYAFAVRATRAGYAAEFFSPCLEMLFPDQGFDVGREILGPSRSSTMTSRKTRATGCAGARSPSSAHER